MRTSPMIKGLSLALLLASGMALPAAAQAADKTFSNAGYGPAPNHYRPDHARNGGRYGRHHRRHRGGYHWYRPYHYRPHHRYHHYSPYYYGGYGYRHSDVTFIVKW